MCNQNLNRGAKVLIYSHFCNINHIFCIFSAQKSLAELTIGCQMLQKPLIYNEIDVSFSNFG